METIDQIQEIQKKKKKMTQPQVSEHDKAEVTQDTCSLLQIASHHVWAKSDCKSV